MKEIELKPCPFCGGKAKEEANYLGQLSVVCESCEAKVFFIKDDYTLRKRSETRTPKERGGNQ